MTTPKFDPTPDFDFAATTLDDAYASGKLPPDMLDAAAVWRSALRAVDSLARELAELRANTVVAMNALSQQSAELLDRKIAAEKRAESAEARVAELEAFKARIMEAAENPSDDLVIRAMIRFVTTQEMAGVPDVCPAMKPALQAALRQLIGEAK